ncbi:HTH-type transcriptional repressor YvoA [Oxobacter pfennigii]|uniref:HTH-type transcriptional repressor YvoA n=2 Tax=Oxobacter pfennigii TaxID=36849 RepID=A0A0P8WW56_9CLOT|nr:HTH-type transcriptional repressor YvoA [Oxobacter pfennigii]
MSNVPIYISIAEDIKEQIMAGKLAPKDIIPSEYTLCEQYNTSRMTVRRALSTLVTDGFIYSIPGKGYFVSEPKLGKYILEFDEKKSIGVKIDEEKLLNVDIINPTIELVYNLQIPQNKRVVTIKSLFLNNGNQVAYDEKYIPYYTGIPIVEEEISLMTFKDMVSNKSSSFALKKQLKIAVNKASKDIADLLDINPNKAIVIIEQKISDENYQPVGWRKIFCRNDYFNLSAVSTKKEDI